MGRTLGGVGGCVESFGLLFERDAIDFAGRVERHFVEDDDFAGRFVADAGTGELDELGDGRR